MKRKTIKVVMTGLAFLKWIHKFINYNSLIYSGFEILEKV